MAIIQGNYQKFPIHISHGLIGVAEAMQRKQFTYAPCHLTKNADTKRSWNISPTLRHKAHFLGSPHSCVLTIFSPVWQHGMFLKIYHIALT